MILKKFRYLPVIFLLLQPVIGSANPNTQPPETADQQTIAVDALANSEAAELPRPHTPNAAQNPNIPQCRWLEMNAEERAKVWPTLSPRHRDYHWRLMSLEERTELRNLLPKKERRKLRERFVMSQDLEHENDRPYVLYKRLSRDELAELRDQVRQAHKQIVLSNMLKTPAQIEYEDEFLSHLAEQKDHRHRMLIITIQENPNQPGTDSLSEQTDNKNRSTPQ